MSFFSSRARAVAVATALLVAATGLPACGGGTGETEVHYSVSAEQNYHRGLEALKKEQWIAGIKYFQFVKARFPYSRYAVLSELRLADAEFGAEHYMEAIDSYQQFIKFHPTHEMVVNGYASYRIGEAYYHLLPSDFFLLPPSYEKDQTSTRQAFTALSRFVEKYPSSRFAPRARKLLGKVNGRLAQHEWYVARFYWSRGKPMGTVLRLRTLLKKHPGTRFDAAALWLLGRAYQRVGMKARARATWKRLVKEFPTNDKAHQARAALAKISG